VSPDELLRLFDALVGELREALSALEDWGPSGLRDGQYRHDVVADGIVVGGLTRAGLRVLSEESGLSGSGPITVVVDPVDGSTNASLQIPWYATSLCAVDATGPLCSLVENLATGERFRAVRGQGAERNGETVRPSGVTDLRQAIVGFAGLPDRHAGWRQYRSLGAAALDLCSVAAGRLDGYLDCSGAHGVWDYLGAWLVCRESGTPLVDARGRELVVLDPAVRRAPAAAATRSVLDGLLGLVH
jgi:fructose-1,6-bisphosphatase/inositol monophosphatase family enzyme